MSQAPDDGRQQEVLRFVRVPRTAEEVAEHLGCHLQTARQSLWALRDQNLIQAGPTKPGRRKSWQAKSGHHDTGDMVMTSAGTIALRDIAFSWNADRATPYVKMLGGCLAYLWRRSYYQQMDQSKVTNVAKQGTLDPLLEVRVVMERVFETMAQLHETLEYMISDMTWLWSDDPEIIKMLGPVNRAELEEAAEWFELWARERL